MSQKRLAKLRRRAFEAGITGNSKMNEEQLVEALHRIGRSAGIRSLWGTGPRSGS